MTETALPPNRIEIPLDPHDRDAAPEALARMRALFTQSKDDVRTTYDRYVAQTPLATGVTFDEVTEPPGWWCEPEGAAPDAALLHLHGGGYTNGHARAFRGLASQLAARTRLRTFVLDYPLVPEAPFPAAFDAALTALAWLAKSGVRSLGLTGDSAGGGLALAALNAVQRGAPSPRIFACATFSAWVDMTLSGSSIAFADPVLAPGRIQHYAELYAGDQARDPRASPLFDTLVELPPLLLQTGRDEQLLDDSVRYANAAARAGGQVVLEIWEGMHHVFQLNVADLVASQRALDRAAAFLRRG